MAKPHNDVDRLQTVSPCATDWEQVTGDDPLALPFRKIKKVFSANGN